MRNDIKNKNKNGENEMNNNNKNIHLMNLDGHTNADGIVRFKENTHEWKLSQEMNGESDGKPFKMLSWTGNELIFRPETAV